MKKKKILIYIAFALIMAGLGASDSQRGIFAGIFEKHFDLTMSRVSLIVTVSYIGNLVFILLGSRLADRFEKKKVFVCASFLWMAGLLLYVLTDNYYALLVGMFVTMGTSTLMNTMMNIMSPMVFGASAGMLINTLFFTQGIGTTANQNITGRLATDYGSFRLVNIILICLGIAGTLIVLMVKFPEEKEEKGQDVSEQRTVGVTGKIIKNPAFFLFVFIFGFYFIAEHGIMNWWKTYLERSPGFDSGKAAVYLSIFFGGMTLGRLIFSPFVSKLGEMKSMLIFGGAGTVLYIAGLAGGTHTALLLSISGLFISIVYPTMVLFIRRFFPGSIVSSATGMVISTATVFDIAFNFIFGRLVENSGFTNVMFIFPVSMGIFYALYLALSAHKKKGGTNARTPMGTET